MRYTGSRFMSLAVAYGVARGASKGFLAADLLNSNAMRLYERFGFFHRDSDGTELQLFRP